jgi:cellobiose transport system substrate-binding protein
LFKKIRLLPILVLCVFLTLAACSGSDEANTGDREGEGSSTQQQAADDQVQLTMWVFGSTGYEALAERYTNEVNPNVIIDIQFSEREDMHSNLFTALSAGSGAPDITMIEVAFIDRYRNATDLFYNLYDYGAEAIRGDYLDWKWDMGQNAERTFLVGLPTDIGPTVMYYRKDVFEEAGLPTDPDEVSAFIPTWEEFREVALQIKERTGKPIVDGPELLFNALRDQAPEHYFNTEDELILETSPYVKAAYDYTVQLIQEGVVGFERLWSTSWGNAMSDGSYAVLLAPAWMQGQIKGNAPDSAGLWALTTMPEGAGNWGGSFVAIPKQSNHPAEAYDFISWLVSPENQLESYKDQGLFPSTPSIYNDPTFTDITDDYFSGIATAKVFSEAAEQVVSVYTGPNYQLVTNEFITALFNVLENQADPEEEWEDTIRRIKRQIDRQ